MQGDINDNACSSTVSFCPSFNSYASSKLVDIAANVAERQETAVVSGCVGEDFEFVSDGRVGCDARELFVDGQIRQVFPVFNRALLLNEEDGYDNSPRKLRVSLKNLFLAEGGEGGREGPSPPPSSPSSSCKDQLEGIPEDTYCVWSPKRNAVASISPNRSNSTGSTSSFIGWFKFPRLLRRSNSEGGQKDSFLFLHKKKTNAADCKAKKQQRSKEAMVKHIADNKLKLSPLHEVKLSPSHPVFFMKKPQHPIKEGESKNRSPYKQDLLGFFVNNVSSLGKTFAPF